MVPFNPKYLSGFDSEEYTIGLDNGFELAKVKMDNVIRKHVRYDIGGDRQQIKYMDTRYTNTTYKNVLFPIWTAQFKWQGKVYKYAINGQTGKVTGERPYSWVKITLLIISVMLLIGGGLYLEENPNIIKNLDEMNFHLNYKISY